MGFKRRFLTASALAVMITALSAFFGFGSLIGEFLMLPGLIINSCTELLLTILLTEGDNIFRFPNGSGHFFNVVFYAVSLFFILWLCELIQLSRSIEKARGN